MGIKLPLHARGGGGGGGGGGESFNQSEEINLVLGC